MSVLITGGAGFVGSNLARHLIERGEEVTVVDSLAKDTENNIADLRAEDNFDFVKGDLRKEDVAADAVDGHEEVYHLAARTGGVGYNRDFPADILADNDLVNRNVFDACVQHEVERVVYAGSSMVFSEAEEFPVAEEQVGEIPPPRGSYGFNKLNGEYYCDAYNRQYGMEYSIARFFNAVGPGDWPAEKVGHAHVVPDMVKKIVGLEQNPVRVKGSGEQTRCFTDTRDLVRGIRLCMKEEQARNEDFNIGSTEEVTVLELVKTIWRLSDREGEPRLETEIPFEKDIKRRVPSIEKARNRLSWKPEFSLEETIEHYLSAYRDRLL